jgi:hypothetical protein
MIFYGTFLLSTMADTFLCIRHVLGTAIAKLQHWYSFIEAFHGWS